MEPLLAGIGAGLVLGLAGLAYALYERGNAKDARGMAALFELRFQTETKEHKTTLDIAKANAEKYEQATEAKERTIADLTKRNEELTARAVSTASVDELLDLANSMYKDKASGPSGVRGSSSGGT